MPIPLPSDPLILAAVALITFVAAIAMLLLVRSGKRKPAPRAAARSIDISALDSSGPPESGVQLEFYGTPVRLAIVVVAPVGRGSTLPEAEKLPVLFDSLVPGLMEVVTAHQPLLLRWPEQLSSQGFVQAFFNHAALPGDRGKGTPWCSIAGKFSEAAGEQFLIGLVCCANKPNGLSQVVVQHQGQWMDILRLRR